MNIPTIDLETGLNLLCLAKVQQILKDAAFVGATDISPQLNYHIRTGFCRPSGFDITQLRGAVKDELIDILETHELELWLDELGLDGYTSTIIQAVYDLMNGTMPIEKELFSRLTFTDREYHGRKTSELRNRSGYYGVWKTGDKYRASVYDSRDRCAHGLGRFDTAEQAALAVNTYIIDTGYDHYLNKIRLAQDAA